METNTKLTLRLVLIAALLLLWTSALWPSPPPVDTIKVKMGRPYVIRGPLSGEGDSPYSEVELEKGIRSFFSLNTTWYIDGLSPLYINGTKTQATGLQVSGTSGSCGNWLQDIELVTETPTQTYFGLVHNETACDYSVPQTHKSVSLAYSLNRGITWSNVGTIITGTDSPTPGALTGIGDCTMITLPNTNYIYAYCLRQSDWKNIVIRADKSDLSPGQWWKWNGANDWSSPGLGGPSLALNSDTLNFLGSSAGVWNNYVLLVTPDWGWGGGGVKLSFSQDGTTFSTLPAPLTPSEPPLSTHSYISTFNRVNGSDRLADSFLLSFVYRPPGTTQIFLVMQGITITTGPASAPSVLLPLTRWYSSINQDRWTTTGPPLGTNPLSYGSPRTLGYLLSKPTSTATVRIDECVSNWPGHPEHLLTNENSCRVGGNPYEYGRAAGWAYSLPQPGIPLVPLYRCFSISLLSHFGSTDPACDGLGHAEWTLGYIYPPDPNLEWY